MAYTDTTPMNKPPVLNDTTPPDYRGGTIIETHPNKYINGPATGGVLLSSHPIVWGHNASANGNGNTQNGNNG